MTHLCSCVSPHSCPSLCPPPVLPSQPCFTSVLDPPYRCPFLLCHPTCALNPDFHGLPYSCSPDISSPFFTLLPYLQSCPTPSPLPFPPHALFTSANLTSTPDQSYLHSPSPLPYPSHFPLAPSHLPLTCLANLHWPGHTG